MKRTFRSLAAVLLSASVSFAGFGSDPGSGSGVRGGSDFGVASGSSETVDGRAGCCKDRQ